MVGGGAECWGLIVRSRTTQLDDCARDQTAASHWNIFTYLGHFSRRKPIMTILKRVTTTIIPNNHLYVNFLVKAAADFCDRSSNLACVIHRRRLP